MRKRLLLVAAFTLLALIVLSMSMGVAVTAQGVPTPQTATPQPSPTNNGGKAQWTIKAQNFQSNYPKGFEFDLDATSSGGKIKLATVHWKHTPNFGAQALGKVDAAGKITASWVPSVSGSVPQWVGVDYWWSLIDEAGNIFETPHKYEEYADNTRKWTRSESEDVLVFVQEGLPNTIAPTIIKAVHDNRAHYVLLWGKLLNYRPRVIVYADYKPWTEWNPGINVQAGGRVFIGGQTGQEWGGTVQLFVKQTGESFLPGWDPVQDLAYETVLHEFGHLYQFANGIQPTTGWFIEGDAEFNANYPLHLKGIAARTNPRIQANDVPSLQGDGPTVRGQDALDGYDFGFLFYKWLEQTYGPTAHLKLWTLAGKGTSVEDSIQAITGMNLVDTDTAFRKWLGLADPVAPTPMDLPAMDFPPTPDYSKPTATP